MEENSQANSEVEVMVVDSGISGPVKVQAGEDKMLLNGVLQQENKEGINAEEEEIALEGEFIKVEKESLDLKDGDHTAEEAKKEQDNYSSVMERCLQISEESSDILQDEEQKKELEVELEKMTGMLKQSQCENTCRKEEIIVIKKKLVESERHCEELELHQKRMQEQLREADKYSQQLSTLQEALETQEAKHKELMDVKEAFDVLTIELENSRKKILELDQELQSASRDAQKFEELSKENDVHASSEMQKALELERLLECAKVGAEEMEGQMASLQKEIKSQYKMIAGVEEAHRHSVAELSAAQGDLELSKSHMLDLQKRLTSEEAVKCELSQEIALRKASETQMKEHILALENLFSSTKENLVLKVSELEEIKSKLHHEVETRELVEDRSKTQEEHISTAREELAKVAGEKIALEAAVEDLNIKVMQLKEMCNDLDTKLKLSDENFYKADSLLSQALSNNTELEQKLKSVVELHNESESVAAIAAQKNLELEGIVGASNVELEEMKSQLRKMETKWGSTEQKNVELEQQLTLVEQKSNGAERELRDISEKASELNDMLRGVEEEKQLFQNQAHEYKEKITQLENALKQSSLRNSELEQELKDTSDKCVEHEGRANATHERSLQLDDLIQVSHSKMEDADRKVCELEQLMEAANNRTKELEEHINTLEIKCIKKEEESAKFSEKVSELLGQLEIFQGKATSLEVSLQEANKKEMQLQECLNLVTEEKNKFETLSSDSTGKLSEAEDVSEILQNELKSAIAKLESIEEDLRVSRIRETETMEKLKFSEEQVKQLEILNDQANAIKCELDSLQESFVKESELKLKEAIINFTNKDAEANSLYVKLDILEDQRKTWEEKAAEANERSDSLKVELDQNLMKLVDLDGTIIELKGKVSEAEDSQACLAEKNLQLEKEVNELQELLKSASAEKEATFEQLASHMNTISELTDQRSRASVLQSENESRIKKAELELQEAIEKYMHGDLYAKDLNEKLTALESQLRVHEEAANEASSVADTRKVELEEALLKINHVENIIQELQTKSIQSDKECEGLAETNMKLTQELVAYETKLNELQNMLSTALTEKDETLEQLHSSNNMIEDLTQRLAGDGQKLQSQISSVTEENNMLTETYQNARKELEATINQLQVQLDEENAAKSNLMAEVESSKVEIAEASVLRARILDIEQQSMSAENRLKEEVDSIKAVAAQKEAELVSKLEEQEVLRARILEIEQESLLAKNQLKEEVESIKEVAARKEVELVSKLEEEEVLQTHILEIEQQLRFAENRLNKEVESIKAVAAQKEVALVSKLEEHEALQARSMEIEQQLVLAESRLKEEVESIKAVAAQKEAELVSNLEEQEVLRAHILKIEQQLLLAENRLKEEVESIKAVAAQKEAELVSQLEEHGDKVKERDILSGKAPKLQMDQPLTHTTIFDQGGNSSVGSEVEMKEVKARELGSGAASTSKRQRKKTSAETLSHGATTNLTFILGIALVSVIIGIILGKRY